MLFFRVSAVARSVLAAFLVGGLAASASAVAADRQGEANMVSRQVAMADLNLNAVPDRQVLRHRVAVAAHGVCEEVAGGSLGSPAYDDCFQQAARAALDDVAVEVARVKARSMVASAGRR